MAFEAGVSTYIFEDVPLSLNSLREIKESGFNLIELWGRKPHLDFTNLLDIKKIKSYVNSLGIKIISFHSPFGEGYDLSSRDKVIRRSAVKGMINSLDALEEVGGERLIIHGGMRIEGERGPHLASLRASLEELLKVCERKKKVLTVENMLPRVIGDTSEELWEIVNSFNSIYMGICLDTGHAHVGGELIQATKKFQSRLLTLHVSDNHGTSDEHLLPGEGSINWPEFIEALAQGSYEGPFMYELVKRENNLVILKRARAIYENFKQAFKENLV